MNHFAAHLKLTQHCKLIIIFKNGLKNVALNKSLNP